MTNIFTTRVLYICTGNSYRSPVAEALTRRYHPEMEVEPAGTAATDHIADEAERDLETEDGKPQPYLAISLQATALLLAVSFLLYPTSIPVIAAAAVTSVSLRVFTVGLASLLTGLEPKSRLYDLTVFGKYLLVNSVFVLPLLTLSVVIEPGSAAMFAALSLIPGLAGVALLRN